MRVDLVLTIIGPDRPGLVELVSRTVSNHEGNWEASRMARMAGRFAGILQVTVPEEQAASLSAALAALDAQGLRVVVERGPVPAPPTAGATRRLKIELVGHDRPGVIRDVSGVLAERGVNVEELATTCDSAPVSGGALLRVTAHISAPVDLAPDALRALVEARAPDFMVDVGLLSDPAGAN